MIIASVLCLSVLGSDRCAFRSVWRCSYLPGGSHPGPIWLANCGAGAGNDIAWKYSLSCTRRARCVTQQPVGVNR